jgi:hypothetical protein
VNQDDELHGVARGLSWVFLIGFLFVAGAARAVYSSHGAGPSARFELLSSFGWCIFLWYWLREQCRRHQVAFPLDLGLFVMWTGIVLVPYYLWRYEHWRGLGKVGLLAGAYAASRLVSLTMHLMLVALG